jgi:neutral ceramidase
MNRLRAGVAVRDITPPLGLPLGGYGARVGGADGILDPLACRALMLDDGEPVAIVVLDLIHVFGTWAAAVKQRAKEAVGVTPDRVLIAATHTHAGPGVFRSSMEGDDRLTAFEATLAATVVECLRDARDGLAPAQLRFGAARAAGVAANRRDPRLPIDDDVRVMSAVRDGGEPIGLVANFACHPTVLSATNHRYSADLLGEASRQAERQVGAPVLFLNGAAGDVSTRFTRRGQTAEEVRRLGDVLAGSIVNASLDAAPVGPRATRLDGATRTLKVQWRELPSPEVAERELSVALAELQALRGERAPAGSVRLAQSRVEGAQASLWLAARGGWSASFGEREPCAEVQALRCDDVALVAAPGELFSEAGAWLRARLGPRTFVVGYANDYLGYFIPPSDAAAGGYEALVAMTEPACEPVLRRGLVELAGGAGCEVRERGSEAPAVG